MTPSYMTRRRLALALALGCASFGLAAQMPGKAFPHQPIKIVVPYPPGGGSDGLMRQLAITMSKDLNTPVIVDNRPGANTMLGTEFVAKQPADGYTLLYVDSAFTINPALYPMRYSAVDSFAPVALVTEIPLVVLAHNDTPFNTLPEFLANARREPGKRAFASYGQGSRAHLAGEMLAMETQTKLLHVPFKGSADALNNLMGKHVDVAITTIEPALPLIRSGKVKILAVTTPHRTPSLPNAPTVAETVPGFATVGWGGVVAPKGTPPDVIKRLGQAIHDGVQKPEVRERVYLLSNDVRTRNAESMDAMIRAEVPKWQQVVKAANIQVN